MSQSSVTLFAILMVFGAFVTPSPAHPASDTMFLSETLGGGHGRGGANGDESSEHRAVANRIWYLNTAEPSLNLEVTVLRADGSVGNGTMKNGRKGRALNVDTRPMDGSMDGIFNLYVVERSVTQEILEVRVAKANMINHSCGWRHPYKFDPERLRAKSLPSIPLEIVGNGLWDANFHTKTMSGDRVTFQVLSYGRPLAAAPMVFETGSGWEKTVKTDREGKVTVQLIRDYFPDDWTEFDSRKRGLLLVSASCDIAEQGTLEGVPYSRMRAVSSLQWRYQPARQEYTSYAWGLGLAVLFTIAAGAGTYLYRERRSRPYREVELDEAN